MRERDPAQPPLGGNHFRAIALTMRANCAAGAAQCGRPFGLIRRHRGGKQFCSVQCLSDYTDGARVEPRLHGYDFLYQRR